ncbi:MAG: SDR family oxidoreductase [Chloroflexi bacterium]|nr:SDR family oxidoreductase [Chloroflexota bacterium]
MDLLLGGKVAVVTGGGSGIGQATALTLAREGANLVVADRNIDGARATADEIRRLGGSAIAVPVDVSDAEKAREMVEAALAEYGQLDILVNNAGVAFRKLFVESDRRDWDIDIHVNLYGAMNCCKAAIQHMIDRRYGKIVNIASDAGKTGEQKYTSYAAAKAGVIAFTKSLAREVGRYHINVNSISPGTIETPLSASVLPEDRGPMIKMYPMGRLGKPEDVANAVVFLCSDLSEFITGQAISVNGGYLTA